jgi:glycosyltransferase involved in cell wall biosynthesis
MKKKYIFFTGTIGTIGGGQIYVRNKVKYLQETGWEVEVFSYLNDKIMIDDLRSFENNIIRILQYQPKTYSKRQRERVIEKVSSSLGKSEWDEVVIESHEITLALWGEIIAKETNGKHIVYLLSEDFPKLSPDLLKFFDFKHKRKELAGIHNKSLELLFKDYKRIAENEKYSLRAICTNSVVDDVPNDIIDELHKKDINIGCISRLQKPFVSTMVDEVVQFSRKNNDKSIQLVIVGESPDHSIERSIIKKTENVKNLNLVMTGRLFPIPKKLFKKIDIFISAAGSARVSVAEGVLTLAIDVINHKPIGLLGYDTNDALYAQNDTDITISCALEKILIKEKIQNEQNKRFTFEILDFRKEYPNHLDFICNSDEERIYYDISDIKLDRKGLMKKYIINVLGVNNFEALIRYKSRLTFKTKSVFR